MEIACQLGHIDIVKYLINIGASVTNTKKNTYSCVSFACDNNHVDIVKLLIENGANVNDKYGEYSDTLLYFACDHDCIDIVKLLLNSGNYNNFDDCWYNVCQNDCMDIAELLSEHFMNNATDGTPPLHIACIYTDYNIAKMMIEKGCDVNAINIFGNTCLHAAVINNTNSIYLDDIVKLLIKNGANIFAKNTDGVNPYQIAINKSQNNNCELFKKEIAKRITILSLIIQHDVLKHYIVKNIIKKIFT